MLENYHKWDKVSCFPKTHPFPGGRLCLHLRDDPRLRKRGAPIFPFLVPSRSSMTWSTACSTTGPWNNIHRFKKYQCFAVITEYVPGWSMQRRGYWRCDKCENYGWYQGGLVSFICFEKTAETGVFMQVGAMGGQLWRAALPWWLRLVSMPTWTIHTAGDIAMVTKKHTMQSLIGQVCPYELCWRQKLQDNGQWINNVTYCGGMHNKCDTDIIVTIANVSMTVPGVSLPNKIIKKT